MFKPGQLVKRRKSADWNFTHFTALLAGNTDNMWVADKDGYIQFLGQVQIAFTEIGMFVSASEHERLITVLFGDKLVSINRRDLESYEP